MNRPFAILLLISLGAPAVGRAATNPLAHLFLSKPSTWPSGCNPTSPKPRRDSNPLRSEAARRVRLNTSRASRKLASVKHFETERRWHCPNLM